MTDLNLKIGSLFTGYGGLDMAAEAAFGATTAWVSDIDKGARKIIEHRYPDVPNLGDITAIDWSTVEPVDIITGGSPCFPAGTLVDTIDGYRPIETIEVGELVRTHTGRYMPVCQRMSREAADTWAVKVMGVPEFITTAEHPFYVRTKGRTWNNDRRQYDRVWTDPEWVSASELTPDHFVGFQLDEVDDAIPALGEQLARLIGRWLGDGWIRNGLRTSPVPQGNRGSRVSSRWWKAMICCAHEEAADLAELIAAAGFVATATVERTATKFCISSKALVELLQEFGHGAAGKRVPGWVYRLPVNDQRALWEGWASADGSTTEDGKVRVTTVSDQLAHGMARVARNAYRRAVSVHRFHMPSTCVIEGRTVNQRDQYQVVLPAANREAFVEGQWCWTPVRSASPDDNRVQVFNIGVAEDESYTAWGITVHNCQDLSHAGKRAGMTDGTRSNLWVAMREAIAELEPTYVIWENVRGAYSAAADSALEHCPGCMGETRDRGPVLRALGRVLGDLSDLGYDAQWRGLRAADVGAPHGRFRVFVVARLADADSTGLGRVGRVERAQRDADGRRSEDGVRHEAEPAPLTLFRTPTSQLAVNGGSQHPDKRKAGGHGPTLADEVEHLLPTPAVNDMGKAYTPEEWDAWTERMKAAHGNGNGHGKSLEIEAARLIPTPSAADALGGHERRGGARADELLLNGMAKAGHLDRFGQYAAAIQRWEAVIGIPAPAPAEPTGRNGAHRLSPRFTEWMMGLPPGWIADVPGITRNEALKACGNGVVPQQAYAAIVHALDTFDLLDARAA